MFSKSSKLITESIESMNFYHLITEFPFATITLVEDTRSYRQEKFDITNRLMSLRNFNIAKYTTGYYSENSLFEIVLPINLYEFNIRCVPSNSISYEMSDSNLQTYVNNVLNLESNQFGHFTVIEVLVLDIIKKYFNISNFELECNNSYLADKRYQFESDTISQNAQVYINRKAMSKYQQGLFSKVSLQDRIFKQISINQFINDNHYSSHSKAFSNLPLLVASIIFTNLSASSFEFKREIDYI